MDRVSSSVNELLSIMAQLRDPAIGCDWDIAQNFASIAPHTIEEAYEVYDAIARSDLDDLRDELGDLLLQIVFYAQIASESDIFNFADITETIIAKLIRRHPHIFDAKRDDVSQNPSQSWEQIKEQERRLKSKLGTLDDVAMSLPALMRAEKLQKRAARVGFDWPDVSGAAAKVHEEIRELDEAQDEAECFEEGGDLLFSIVNLLRKRNVDPEHALRAANRKFERRFAQMEQRAADAEERFADLDLEAKELLWQAVKHGEKTEK